MKRPQLWLAAAMLLLIAAMMLKGELLALPPVPERAPEGAFDANRAVARLQRVLGDERPHPVDSAANDAVRERLIAELRALGLNPQVTDDFACNGFSRGRTVSCARIRNVLATIGPVQEDRHLLVVSHYDSTSAGPGAADAGIGVATMLELAHLLRDAPLTRPVTFLFNEGEEAGLIGARAFLRTHPLAARVDSIVNLEARGVEGPAMMFETSRPNAPAISAFAPGAVRPVANSMMTDFYRMLPNSTDVAVFEERPFTILNFAIGGNETRYHSSGDDLAALDRRSVRHMGDQALAAVTRLGAGVPAAQGDRLFMDLAGRRLIVLPVTAGLVLLGLLTLVSLFLAVRRRSGLLSSLGAIVAALILATALAWLGQWLMSLMREGAWWRGHPDMTSAAVYAGALAACAAMMIAARKRGRARLRAAFWLLFLLVGCALSFVAPGASILFLLPPVAPLAGMLLSGRFPVAERIGAVAGAAVLFLIFGPFIHLLEMFLGHGAAWVHAPLAAMILLPFLIELAPLAEGTRFRTAAAALVALLVAAWAAVGITPAYSRDRQQIFGIEYLWDQDSRQGRWLIGNDGAPLPEAFARFGPWQRGMEVPYSGRRRWAAPAPRMALASPALEAVTQRPARGGRIVTFTLRTGGADSVLIRLPAQARAMRGGSSGFDRPFGGGGSDDPFYLRCTGRSCDGREFAILLGSPQPVEATLVSIRNALPPGGEALQRARPRNARPQYGTDATVVVDRLRL